MYNTYGNPQSDWLHLAGDTLVNREPIMNLKHKWEYEDGLMLNGMYEIYLKTDEPKYLDYIKSNIDAFVHEDGQIDGYNFDEFNLDHLNNGKILIDLYKETNEEKYKLAAKRLHEQILVQPRTPEGTYWHKEIYPNQVWLDGLYMGSAFYAKYLDAFSPDATEEYADVMHQFITAYDVTVDQATGLCFHAYDAAKVQPWANPENGHSPHFWTRSIGWFVMAMVDSLEYFKEESVEKATILTNLTHLLNALRKVADEKTNLWYQIPDQGDRKLNYLESSGSLMILTAIAKAIRLGYIERTEWEAFLLKGHQHALEEFISLTKEDYVNVNKIVYVGGLGGASKRDGSYAYYMSEPIVANDHKGVGPFLLLVAEMHDYFN